ncbi:hypothetical protein C0Q70_12817 [Pomacea canaliculata]|uniref:Uncharacterized protein n=1 Tax=Pomacea canaliculata TaxID=400727 RepID=A0A2T7P2L6_POMCA|nr:hypothetical protein C0Q70_12817 [Pomacea canaliculata]
MQSPFPPAYALYLQRAKSAVGRVDWILFTSVGHVTSRNALCPTPVDQPPSLVSVFELFGNKLMQVNG